MNGRNKLVATRQQAVLPVRKLPLVPVSALPGDDIFARAINPFEAVAIMPLDVECTR